MCLRSYYAIWGSDATGITKETGRRGWEKGGKETPNKNTRGERLKIDN